MIWQGFCKEKSCLSNLLEFFEHVYKTVDKGKPAQIIYLDFYIGFDKDSYKKLIGN